jgi:hypothetical protein
MDRLRGKRAPGIVTDGWWRRTRRRGEAAVVPVLHLARLLLAAFLYVYIAASIDRSKFVERWSARVAGVAWW